MRSPWHTEQSRDHQFEQKTLFGNLIERSTSAPPKSMDHSKLVNNRSFLGNDNSNFLFGNSNRPSNDDDDDDDDGDFGLFRSTGNSNALSFGHVMEDSSGRSTAPLSLYGGGGGGGGTSLSNALLSSGLSSGGKSRMPIPRSVSLGMDHHHHHSDSDHPLNNDFIPSTEDDFPFMRSRSAAPTFLQETSRLAPPPGLGHGGLNSLRDINNHSRDSHIQAGMRRSTSAGPAISDHETSSSVLGSLGIGVGGNGGDAAVRPAAKTLMDLIKEDSPPPLPSYHHHHNDTVSTPSYETSNKSDGHHQGTLSRSHSSNHYYERNDNSGYVEIERHSGQYDAYSNEQPDRYRGPEYSKQSSSSQGINSISHRLERLHVGPHGQQHATSVSNDNRMEGGHTAQFMKLPMPQGHRGMTMMNQHQEPHYHDHARPQPRQVFPSLQQPVANFDGQSIYFANDQKGPNMVMDQGLPFTAAVLPNGQTVYFNYAPNPHIHYPAHQQARMMHPQHLVQGQEYMPVMPIQAGGHLSHFQGVDSAVRGHTVLMNHPLTMNRVLDPSSPQGRTKDSDRNGKNSVKGRRGGPAVNGGRRDDNRNKVSHTSHLLEEFRTTKNRDWTMLDISGSIVEFCQDQNGSRFIQQRLEIGNPSEQLVVMAEVLPAVRVLRNDVFGNYVVQKLLEFGTPLMKNQLRETLEGEMLNLSLQMYGCRVVQKALETLDEDHLPKLLTEFHHNVLSCIHDQNGNHVIQKCIEVMSMKAKVAFAKHDGERANFFGEQIDFILNDVLDNVTPLSCHPYGCRVLQRILEHCVEPKKIQALDEIAKCHKILLDDQYGNYVIQHVLQYGRRQDRESIMHIVIANGLLPLSKQKFASNVVEKLLKYGDPTQRNLLVREMLVLVDDPKASSGSSPSRNGVSSVVLLMVRDAYANYVVQTTLDVVAEGEEKRLLLEELNAHADQLRQYTFAKHIVTKLNA